MRNSNWGTKSVAALAGLAGLAGLAPAQGLVASQGSLVATDGDPIPDANGVPIPNFTFGQSGALGDNCVIAPDGNVFFRARLLDSGGGTTTWNDRAYFRGTSRADLRMVVRGGEQAPTLSPGVILRSQTGFSSTLSSAVRLTPDGKLLWGALFIDSLGTAQPPITGGVNDEAVFGGYFGSQGVLVRKGDSAPGTVGARFAQALASPNLANLGMNREGRLHLIGALAGGDTVTTSGMNNQTGLWAGLPGALELVQRKSNPASGLPGTYVIDTSGTAFNFAQMNDAGQLLYDVVLSTTQGTSPAVAANDRALLVHTPGAGSQKLVREGDTAPSAGGPTFNAISGDAWAPVVSVNAWTRNAQTIFVSDLRGGGSTTANDRAIYMGGTGGLTEVAREGSPAAGTDGNFLAFNTSTSGATNPLLNGSGQVCFVAQVSGGTVTTANDTGIWVGVPGSLNLILREGAVMPGTGGSLAGNFSTAGAVYFNDLGQVLFNVSLAGGTITGTSLWAWDPVGGLYPMVLNGDQVQVSPGVFRTVNGFGAAANGNDDGAGLVFGHDGQIGVRLGLVGSLGAIMTGSVPHPCVAPTVTGQPFAASVCAGSAAHFSVAVAHSTAVTYQWLKNGVPLVDGGNVSGANALHLAISPALAADAASYSCFVTTACGNATSNPAVLNVNATDTDGDGTADCADGCPSDPLKTAPGVCGCGVADADSDADGTLDCNDGCPNDPLKIAPGLCGCGVSDADSDLDGVVDCQDGCPNDPDKIAPGVCGCGVSDNDADNDGTPDCIDGCPNDPLKLAPGVCGCGVADADTDSDGTPDCNDGCPNDPFKLAPGACGCGVADADTDLDGTADCIDGCPTDPLKVAPGVCGCGVADTDTDSDGTADCFDGCPSDPLKIAPGTCGCGVADADADLDGTPDCVDGCPSDPLKVAPGQCGCGVVDVDTDGDSIADCVDNCDTMANAGQADLDSDGVGDACDNCPEAANAGQGDCNGDAIGDACEIFYGVPDCNLNGIPDPCDIASATSQDLNGNNVPDECETNGGTPFCFGYSGCPCGNDTLPGSGQGCMNSTGQGAQLLGGGLTSLSSDGLVLTVSNLPIPGGGGSSFALFFQGDAQTNVPFQDGRRCVSGAQVRLGTKAGAGGVASYPQGGDPSVSVKGLVAGPSARYYQVWYRNVIGPCGTGSNISNGVAVIWVP